MKGAVIGFLLDAKLRRMTDGAKSLDDVMRRMYERFSGEKGFTPRRCSRGGRVGRRRRARARDARVAGRVPWTRPRRSTTPTRWRGSVCE